MSQDNRQSSGLSKLNAVSGFLAATVLPLVIALSGHWYSSALKEREIQGQFVQLAVEILAENPDTQDRAIREWAVAIIDTYSDISLKDAKAGLLKKAPIRPLSERVRRLEPR